MQTTITIQADKSSRITRYGIATKTFETSINSYVQTYAMANKKRNKFFISEFFNGVDSNGVNVVGVWEVIESNGKNFICKKVN